MAPGSDNWPITWADDDVLYTAYGDGNGFAPFTGEKLSLGLALVLGAPPEIRGVNIRSPNIEQRGDGEGGAKASGLLMLDGVLYLWMRNAGNSRLAWSASRGQSWTLADWRFTNSFGCPTFLNFGPDYSGAKDEFVYVYSQDSDSAYVPADRMVLARAPRRHLRELEAYEFFQRLEPDGHAIWMKDIAARGGVFIHRDSCYRSGISYHAPSGRYLWCQILPHSRHPKGTRFQGGFGVYDAPEPWGPWTTAFYTEAWDVGPGETSSFPTKWMDPDGSRLHLVFSGDDSFSVREATLIYRSESRR
jgi:hypothetical protein